MLADRSGVDRPGQAHSPTERPASLREIEAVQDGVQVGTAAGEAATKVRNEAVAILTGVGTDCHDS